MEYIFAPITTQHKLEYLQTLIEDYLTEFTRLYPERPLVPKMHYLIHMPTWMKRYDTYCICSTCIQMKNLSQPPPTSFIALL